MTLETWEHISSSRIEFFNPVYVWKCTFANGGMVLQFTADRKVPNRFHRWMHKLILGIVWERIGGEE